LQQYLDVHFVTVHVNGIFPATLFANHDCGCLPKNPSKSGKPAEWASLRERTDSFCFGAGMGFSMFLSSKGVPVFVDA